MAKCAGKTLKGKPCKAAALSGKRYCLFHETQPRTGRGIAVRGGTRRSIRRYNK